MGLIWGASSVHFSSRGHIPVVSVNLNGMERNEGFTLSRGLIMDAVHALVYGDLFMRCLYHVRPYELEKGSAEAIHQKWKEICVDSLVNPKTKWRYADVCRGIVADFDALPIDETLHKPRVGIVGEILVKYMPLANNHLVELLEAEGAEAVVPDLLDFFNYSIYGRDFRHKNLGTSWKDSVVAKAGVEMLRRLRAPALEALEKSRRFEAPMPIEDVAKLAEPFLAIGNQYGEGWFLTGEMAEPARRTSSASSRSRACRTMWSARASSRRCASRTRGRTSLPWTTTPARARSISSIASS